MTGFILRALIAAGGLWLASRWVGGFVITSTGTLLIAAALLFACASTKTVDTTTPKNLPEKSTAEKVIDNVDITSVLTGIFSSPW